MIFIKVFFTRHWAIPNKRGMGDGGECDGAGPQIVQISTPWLLAVVEFEQSQHNDVSSKLPTAPSRGLYWGWF